MLRATFLLLILATQPIVAGNQTDGKVPSEQPPLAHQFALKDASGRIVRLKDYKGKIVVINFWATWCAPCLAEVREFVRLQRSYRNLGLQVVGVAYPPINPGRVRRLAVKSRINYPLLFGNRRIAKLYGVTDVLPVTIIVGRQGRLEGRIDGVTDLQEVEKFLQ
ncbi:MAG TPA: TlpA disulfide reductase family protein [Blastocatellia bacterium]|jgi:cytochrome c biogenesis protein CcmG/thiol:disulfide interchange protein DsbE|nr:TlpA disulfide reductase family protein [Blastocatellia bacterium]